MKNKKTPLTLPPLAHLQRMSIIGGTIGLVLTSLFIFSADNADPAWSKIWFIKPLIITPIATAMGGVFYYYVQQLFYFNGWKKVLAFIIGLIGFIISLWMGMVLGFNGTYWN